MGSVYYDAAAGSGKTTLLVRKALASGGSVLLTTFTDENAAEIRRILFREAGGMPNRIEVMPWFTFLLRHGVRPFQSAAGLGNIRFSGVVMPAGSSAPMTRINSLQHYACKDGDCWKVYTDKLSELSLVCDRDSAGSVIDRISHIYDLVCVDEVQDMSGYDLEFLAAMLKGGCEMALAGDQRQATYHTSSVRKNKQYRQKGFAKYLQEKKLTDYCVIDTTTLRGCHRCPQDMLDLADALYPGMPRSVSLRCLDDAARGVLIVPESLAHKYLTEVDAVVLRYKKNSRMPYGVTGGYNFGAVKGRTFGHTLLVLTDGMQNWMLDASTSLKDETRAKLYVALTRSSESLGIVIPDQHVNELRGRFYIWSG